MSKVLIYSTGACPFCVRARMLLKDKAVDYDEVRVDLEPQRRPEMIERARGATSVPQIFVGDMHVGGCSELYALERAGRLDELLATVS